MNNASSKTPLLCAIYISLIFIPEEFHWLAGQIRLEPYRIFLILAALLLAPKLIKHKYDKKELALLAYCGLCAVSYIYVHGTQGIQSALILILEVFISYFIGMSINGNLKQFKKCITLIMTFFLILAPFAIIESQNGYRLFHVAFANMMGTETLENLSEGYFRHGLYRASTVFSHPILYSVIATMYLSLIFYFYRPPTIIILSIGVITAIITSVTSAGLLMVILMTILYLMQKIKKNIKSIYKIAVIIAISSYTFLSIASNRGPVQVLIQISSLNPETAYTRYLQWQFASIDIFNHPIFGIGFNEWTRPFWLSSSVDSYWLLTVLQNGFPALLALSIFFILSLKQYWNEFNATSDKLFFCFFVSICAFTLAAFTVDYFDRAQLMLFLTMGFYNSFVSKKPLSVQRESP